MSWQVWFHFPRNVARVSYESQEHAQQAFSNSLRSATLFNPKNEAVAYKRGVFDIRGRGQDAISQAQRYVLTGQESWTVGSHLQQGGVQLESFPTEEAARRRYKWAHGSKVLFCPNGEPQLMRTAPRDVEGRGVALVLRTRKGSDDGLSKDPFVPPDRPAIVRLAMRGVVNCLFRRRTVTYFGSGPYRMQSLCYFDVKKHPSVQGHVALTIDDAPCRMGRSSSLVPHVRALLNQHRALATFMVIGDFVDVHEEDLVGLLEEGHELGNHGMHDRRADEESPDEFARNVSECSEKIRSIQRRAQREDGRVVWFRAPHGKYTEAMSVVLAQHGLTNVMCDTYACCPVIQDGAFIGETLARRCNPGSIILIHMPERGIREWCLPALARLLEGLKKRGLQAVTVSKLAALAAGPVPRPATF